MFGFLSYNSLFTNVFILAAMVGVFYLIIQNKEALLVFLATRNLDAYLFSAIALVKNTYSSAKSLIMPNSAN